MKYLVFIPETGFVTDKYGTTSQVRENAEVFTFSELVVFLRTIGKKRGDVHKMKVIAVE